MLMECTRMMKKETGQKIVERGIPHGSNYDLAIISPTTRARTRSVFFISVFYYLALI